MKKLKKSLDNKKMCLTKSCSLFIYLFMTNEVEKKDELVVYAVYLKTAKRYSLNNVDINDENKFRFVDVFDFNADNHEVIDSVDGIKEHLENLIGNQGVASVSEFCKNIEDEVGGITDRELEEFFDSHLLYRVEPGRWYSEDRYVYEFCDGKYNYVVDYVDDNE